MTGAGSEPGAASRAAAGIVAQRATRILLARQDSAGKWTGRCAGDVTLDAEAVLVREFLGVARPELTRAAAQQIRSMQQPDGSWIGGPEPGRSGDLAASVLAYLALRLAGDSPDAYHLAVAAGWIRDAGGLAAAGLVTRSWLAVFGLAGWDDVPVPAPEFIYLPARYAPGDGDWTALSRQVVVSLTVIGMLRPVRALRVDLGELRARGYPAASGPDAGPADGARANRSRMMPEPVAQRAALRRCGHWLISWQQRVGLPTGRRPHCALSLVALRLLGYPLRHPVMSGGLAWLDSVTARPRQLAGLASAPAIAARSASGGGADGGAADGDGAHGDAASGQRPGGADGPADAAGLAGQVRLAAVRQPPVRDTALAVLALADAGLPADHPALIAAGDWLLTQRISGPAEAAAQYSAAARSGWSFSRDGYPAEADTAEVLLALSRIDLPGIAGTPAIAAAARWLNSLQRRDGSWGRSAGTTALVVQALATHSAPDSRVIRRGAVWLVRAQLADGSWPGRDGTADLQATADAVAALLVAGVVPGKPVIRSAVDWLLAGQNPDGGWHSGAALPDGELRSGRQRQHGSEAAATGRAVLALLAAAPGTAAQGTAAQGTGTTATGTGGAAAAAAAAAGADWLMRAQRPDGGWSERAEPTGRAAGRNTGRRRGALLPGILLPLGALGQYAASPEVIGASHDLGGSADLGVSPAAGDCPELGASPVSPPVADSAPGTTTGAGVGAGVPLGG
ncbi:MAG TPA: prenyltransferase/squalene oxidase repeat-containing protein [Streptosporangiaceae bacterium]|nr:prenyltransferase/squalene oxidase repeat-containing protein [Streptosporangiaceae bacterium]